MATMPPVSLSVFNQVLYVLGNFNQYSNSKAFFDDLEQYVGFGFEGDILVLQSCLYFLNNCPKALKTMQLDTVLQKIFRDLLRKPNFSTIFSEAFEGTVVCGNFLEHLCNRIHLETAEKIGIGFALSLSEDRNLRTCGKTFCTSQIEKLYVSQSCVNSAEQIQKLVFFLLQSDIPSEHVGYFIKMLVTVRPEIEKDYILQPLLLNELPQGSFARNVDLVDESNEDDFDALQDEMQKEINVSEVIREMGYGCIGDVSQCKNMLSLFSQLTENTVAKILGTIARTHADVDDDQISIMAICSLLDIRNSSDLPPLKTWNIDVLVDSIKQLAPGIDWVKVIEHLDHEGFYIPDKTAFSLLMSMYRAAYKHPFPLGAICGSVWKNAEGQLSFLKHAVSVPPKLFTFSHSERKLSYVGDVNVHNNAWLCLDLLEVLCHLAESGHASSVRQMLEFPLKHCPELILLGMAHIHTASSLIPYEVTSAVFHLVLKSTAGKSLTLCLWNVNPNLLLRGFIDSLKMDPVHVTRVLDLSQELKIFPQVLELLPLCFGIRLATFASSIELLDLEKWITLNLTTYKEIFFKECLKFLREVLSVTDLNLSSETRSIFFKALQAHIGLISSGHLSEELEKLHQMFMDADGCILVSNELGIEAEANSYFKKLFSGQLSVETMVQILAQFKISTKKREQAVFECVISNLFQDYRFVSRYPDKQLNIAAVFYGLLIKYRVVTYASLSTSLRAVFDALCKPADSKMFLFGVKALEQFLDRMVEFPQYCNSILQISHLRSTHYEIVSAVEQALSKISSGYSKPDLALTPAGQFRGSLSLANLEIQVAPSPQTPPTVSTSKSIQQQQSSMEEKQAGSLNFPVLTPNVQSLALLSSDAASSQKSKSAVGPPELLAPSTSFTLPSPSSLPKFGGAENIETLLAAAKKREIPIEAPASEIQDKISFIMNNLSVDNIEVKSKELTEYMKEEHYSWFAQYLVMKRLSIERNHHEMYLMFLEKINSKTLNQEVLQSTYENCKVLLASEFIISSSEERELLRNLGSWLGKITIRRDHFLRGLDIDPKLLIIEAYDKGVMFAIVPFISRVLEALVTTRAYIPPNPWTMSILGLLVEIHSFPNLKLNLKFEIEVLFKKICMDMRDVKPTTLLKNRVRKVEGNLDFSSIDLKLPESYKVTEVNSSTSYTSNQAELLLANIIYPSQSSSHSVVSSQHAAPLHNTSATLTEDDKADHLQLSAPLPATQEIPQSQHPLFSFGQFRASTSDIDQQVIVNPKLNALGLQLQFQSLLPIAMDRAIKDIVSSIIQCSVSVATRTTKGLVMKDLAMESDYKHVHNVARNMVTSLACSLAHAICKEPLRISISRQLGTLLQNYNISGELLEQIAQIVTDDNLNLGCAMILQAVTEKAMQNIDVEIGKEILIKRIFRELNLEDENSYAQGFTAILPKSLCPIPSSLSMSQLQVYEDFTRLPVEMVSNLTKVYREENAAAPRNLEMYAVSSSAPELQSAKSCKVVKPSEIARIPNAASVGNSDKNLQYRGEKVAAHSAAVKTDLPEPVSSNFDKKVSKLFAEWYSISELAGSNDEICAEFIFKLFKYGVLNGDDEISVSHCLSSSELDNPTIRQSNQLVKQSLSFLAIDMYSKLVLSILKFSPGGEDLDKRSILLSKVLITTVKYIQKDSEVKKQSFDPRPYYRLFFNWLMDLPSLEPLSDGVNLQVMMALANAFHLLPPLQIPGFSYSWVELVSHRNFMPKLLAGNGQKGWPYYQRLLIHLIQFLEPYLRNAELTEPVYLLYKGTLRVFLVLLQDFPEFLCDYHFSFCDIIPSSCIQLRNLILSAIPRHISLPDPSSPNLKIDLLAEITQPPRILSEVDSAIKAANIKSDIDAYIMTRQQSCQFIHELKQKLILNHDEASRCGTRYNVPLINSIVLYMGMQTIHPSVQAMELFQRLILVLDTEGRYLFLNAMTNQLRHPNTHTYYFSCIILHLFNISNQEEEIQEQISRVLLERILVAKPHPWGLLFTFIELLKNPVYRFWSRSFIKCSQEIEKVFEKELVSILRSCEEPNLPDDLL